MTSSEIRRKKNLELVEFSILIALEAVVSFTALGSLPIGPALVATLSHIPVILACILLGMKGGLILGSCFGLFSFLVWTLTPPTPVIAFAFTPFYSIPGTESGSALSLLIVFIPRILLGVVTAALINLFRRIDKKGFIAYPLASVIGTVMHTVLVLGGIYLFFGEKYAAALGISFNALMGGLITVVGTNGLLEAGIAGVLALAIGKTVLSLTKSGKTI